MIIPVNVINAFSVNGAGGNPAGVVFDADAFSNQQKQLIATAAGFAETAFVSKSDKADFRLDFFTPVKQIPHCGHATIATFSYLKQVGKITGDLSSKETIDGIRQIIFKNDWAYMEQKAPVITEWVDQTLLLRSLGLSQNALHPGVPASIVNTGNSFLIVRVRDAATLAGITPDLELVSSISARYGLIGYYLYVADEEQLPYDANTRMFAPYYGINEEAATGMAAGTLACYLYQYANRTTTGFYIGQGQWMTPPSSSMIHVELELNENDQIKRVYAGGAAYLAGEKIVQL